MNNPLISFAKKVDFKIELLNYQLLAISSIQKVHFICKHLSSSIETKSIIQDRYAYHLTLTDGNVIRIAEGTNEKFLDEQIQKILSYLNIESIDKLEFPLETSEEYQRFKEKN